jgi:hypothetical protein
MKDAHSHDLPWFGLAQGITIFFPIIYFVDGGGDYFKVAKFLGLWSQNFKF